MADDKNIKRLKEHFDDWVESHWDDAVFQYRRGAELCESPIEKTMLVELIYCGFGYSDPPHPVFKPDEGINTTRTLAAIVPQQAVGSYRIDFGVHVQNFRGDVLRIAVECDGHDFHEKTKQQAARDKKRDRFLQAEGWRVFRFTGSEIYRDAAACVEEISDFGFHWIDESNVPKAGK